MGLSDPEIQLKVRSFLQELTHSAVTLTGLKKLSGGAIQENWALDLQVEAGDWAGFHELVLRCDAPTGVSASHGRADEYQLLKIARGAGVQVPTPCFLCQDVTVLGRPFFLMHRLKGTAAGHLLTKQAAQPGLMKTLGVNLARIHSIDPERQGLAFLGRPPANPIDHTLDLYRHYLDAIGACRPAIEFGLAWLQRNAPGTGRMTLCHRDYRTGNLMIDGDHLTGILDWEFAGWGNPMEDIGWFVAKCWRFGAPHREAGGLGDREPFYQAYERQAGLKIDRSEVAYWEVMAHVRWATIACQQADRHFSGAENSLELALTAYIVPELEYEILMMTEHG